ncbi:MAG TPA: methyltransferase domain-containing protein [Candidatus Dormibacteraeota bacterium]|nr:methyltransferase domain-containing protein [Candidatus Dormibacteraeota bacterium]
MMPPALKEGLASWDERSSPPSWSETNGRLIRTKVIPENQNKALHAWQTSARYWDKYRALITEMFAPLTSGLVEEAQIGMGQKVLDIGGGSGEPSLTISRIVGPTGSVTYTDPVAGMIESAQAEAARRGVTNIHLRKCSANDLPFEACTFDAAVGRLSAMFFADPATAVRAALRLVLEDGCVAFAVWGPKEANPFFSTITDVIDRFVKIPPQDPDAPDAFRFAVPGKLAGILEQADAKNVIERQLNFQIEAAISLEQFWQLRTEMSETLREKMVRLTPAQLPTVKQAVAGTARRYFASGTMRFPAEALIVSGRKPGT